jgi:hypothetical protein
LTKALTYRNYSLLILGFKAIVLVGILWLVYDKLWVQDREIGYIQHLWTVYKTSPSILLISCLILAPFNWLFESKKWKLLVSPFQMLTWRQTADAIMSGITLGVLTPSRLGEYGGRLIHIEEDKRGQALYAHFMGSLSQNIPILLFGAISSAVYFSHHYLANPLMSFGLAILILFFTLLLILLYLQNSIITDKLFSLSWLKKHTNGFLPTQYDKALLSNVALFSLIRYCIYVSQYLLLLFYFDINVGISEAITGVCVVFLFQTGLPLPPALSVLARTEIALIVWSVFDNNHLSILTVPILLWMINLLVPAIVGSIIILVSNFQKQSLNV